MMWLRKSFVFFLSCLLLITLLGGAMSAGVNMNLTHPDKLESWLNQSRLYDHFVSGLIDQSQKSEGNDANSSSDSVSLSDAAVQKAAESAFSPQLLQQSVNTFLDSNYAWLQGKTATPEFKIDLSEAKKSFAEQVGQYVRVYTASLPVCTAAQITALQIQPVDPLSATCRLPNVTPEATGAAVTQKLSNSGDFLSNPVITANTLNSGSNQPGQQPYYQKLAHLPKAYQLATKLPLIFGALALVSALGILLTSSRKRSGLRNIAVVLTIAGFILVIVKLVADLAIRHLERAVFNTKNNGQLQQSLTDFAHHLESAIVKTDLLFGIGFLVLALIGFIILFRSRKTNSPSFFDDSDKPGEAVAEIPPPPKQKPAAATASRPTPPPKKPRRPRLIQ